VPRVGVLSVTEKLKLAICQGVILAFSIGLYITIILWATWGAQQLSRWMVGK